VWCGVACVMCVMWCGVCDVCEVCVMCVCMYVACLCGVCVCVCFCGVVCVMCVCVCVVCVCGVFQQTTCIQFLLYIVDFVKKFIFVIHLILSYCTMLLFQYTSSCSLRRMDEFYAENCMHSTCSGMELF